jgi:hypothetical protein
MRLSRFSGSVLRRQFRNGVSDESFILALQFSAFSAAGQMLLKLLPFLERQRLRSGESTQLYEMLVGPVR